MLRRNIAVSRVGNAHAAASRIRVNELDRNFGELREREAEQRGPDSGCQYPTPRDPRTNADAMSSECFQTASAFSSIVSDSPSKADSARRLAFGVAPNAFRNWCVEGSTPGDYETLLRIVQKLLANSASHIDPKSGTA